MTDDAKMTCHCGSVEIRLTLPNGIENVGRCSCSICSRKYAAYVGVDLGNLEVLKGKNDLKNTLFTPILRNTISVQSVEFIRIINLG